MELNVDASEWLLFWQVVFAAASVVQLGFFAMVYWPLLFQKPVAHTQKSPPVSVVIAARNEHDNLYENLPLILQQDYPEYEVIVVNNGSYDETTSLLQALKASDDKLRVVTISEHDRFDGGKKLAVTLGIKAARHERVLLTDADCRPHGKDWISSMLSSVQHENDIVLGYSPYTKNPGVLNALIRYDGVHTALNYIGFALAGMPYMGVGRNLSYPRKQFFDVGGFRSHYSLRSGDDDLFVNQVANGKNTQVCFLPNASMWTAPETTLKHFWRQKRRHLSTGWRYRQIHKLLLMLQPFSFLLFISASLALLIHSQWMVAVLLMLVLRTALQVAVFLRMSRWLGQKDLAFFAPLLEIITLAFAACAHLANASTKQTRWKN
jgi:cellulose synthase/poly-beta-1,6-N-acetylglucosamine synthase-like glycosyltransferase